MITRPGLAVLTTLLAVGCAADPMDDDQGVTVSDDSKEDGQGKRVFRVIPIPSSIPVMAWATQRDPMYGTYISRLRISAMAETPGKAGYTHELTIRGHVIPFEAVSAYAGFTALSWPEDHGDRPRETELLTAIYRHVGPPQTASCTERCSLADWELVTCSHQGRTLAAFDVVAVDTQAGVLYATQEARGLRLEPIPFAACGIPAEQTVFAVFPFPARDPGGRFEVGHTYRFLGSLSCTPSETPRRGTCRMSDSYDFPREP
jgi:hypothetical protein